MRNLVRNAIIVLVAILLAAYAVYPPEKNLRKGKDLAGGASLIYAVNVDPGDPPDTIAKVIEVLKDRVDPRGQLEISIVAQGRDRLEITMPLPSEAVKKLRADFEQTLEELGQGWLSPDEFELLLNLPPEERRARISSVAAGDATRAALLEAAATGADAAREARREFEVQIRRVAEQETALRELESRPEGERDGEFLRFQRAALELAQKSLEAAEQHAAEAELDADAAREAARVAAVSPAEMRRVLRLSNEPRRLSDARSRKVVELPSPRQRALDRLKETHPGGVAQIDRVVQAWNTYERNRQTLDDPSDLIRILRGAGVLNFRITVKPGALGDEGALRQRLRDVGPGNARTDELGWYRLNKVENWYESVEQLTRMTESPAAYFAERGYVVEEYDGEFYMLAYRTPGMQLTEADGEWRLTGAFQGTDNLGRPAITFTMDPRGASRLGRLTENNVGNQMAVILDDEVYTAPTIQGRIANNGQITGVFTPAELNYIIRVLAAGSLQAKLSPEPISQSVLGPQLGADNLRRGMQAGLLSFAFVSVFMVVFYFFCGVISVIALAINALLLLGIMAAQHAAFTLPGIAGVALTFGMAVDANVLIYERMREELSRGADAKTAVRLGYSRALSSIVDGNVTNLIVCVVLGLLGTQEIKGFAITLGVGVLTTLFTQLFATRVLFALLAEKFGLKQLRMLQTVVPGLTRLLTPRIDWISLRWFFLVISVTVPMIGVVMVVTKGSELLGTEFRGGTQVGIQLREDAPVTRRADVAERMKRLALEGGDPSLMQLQNAEIIVVNPETDGVTSREFKIRTTLDNRESRVESAVVRAFSDIIDSQPALEFELDSADFRAAPVYPLIKSVLGENIDQPGVRNPVGEYTGGVAVVLRNLRTAGTGDFPTLRSLESRLSNLRGKPDFADTAARQQRVVVLEGNEGAVQSAAVLVRDPEVSFFADEQRWSAELAQREWALVHGAVTQTSTLSSVESFSPSIARMFRARAAVSVVLASLLIVIYIWVRFSSLRYSIAAIVATVHDCLVAIAMVSLAGVICEHFPQLARTLGLLPFKFDLNLVAAILTVLGYSLNDTIIIMDRIREIRGKLPHASRAMINEAINQTFSRTVVTSGTTTISVLILYFVGGEGVREFSFALLVGIIAGTYSSFGIAAPMVWVRSADETPAETPGMGIASESDVSRLGSDRYAPGTGGA